MAKRKRKKRRPRPAAPSSGGSVAGTPASEPSAVTDDDARRTGAARRKGAPGERPPAPWGSFPLSEIVVLVALVLLVAGFFVAPPRGAIMLGAGLVLGSLAGLELSVREHFYGYRSHTLLLAGAIGVAVLVGLLTLTEINPGVCAAAAALAFGAGAYLFAGAFRRRSGGSL